MGYLCCSGTVSTWPKLAFCAALVKDGRDEDALREFNVATRPQLSSVLTRLGSLLKPAFAELGPDGVRQRVSEDAYRELIHPQRDTIRAGVPLLVGPARLKGSFYDHGLDLAWETSRWGCYMPHPVRRNRSARNCCRAGGLALVMELEDEALACGNSPDESSILDRLVRAKREEILAEALAEEGTEEAIQFAFDVLRLKRCGRDSWEEIARRLGQDEDRCRSVYRRQMDRLVPRLREADLV